MAVPTTYLEVLTLDDMREELRLPVGQGTDLNSRITAAINGAGDFVARHTGQPIIAESKQWTALRFPDAGEALRLPFRSVTSVTEIHYWTPTGELRDEPDGTIAAADLGRTQNTNDETATEIYGPVDGWPEALADSPLQIAFSVGLDPTPAAIRSAMILLSRNLIDGERIIKSTEAAVFALLAPFRRMALPEHAEQIGA